MCKGDGLKKCLIIGAAAFFLLFVVSVCSAGELVAARPALKFAVAFDDTFMVSVPPTDRASSLPSAYLFYSKDGTAFAVKRWFDGSPETYYVDIPANSSLVLPAPSPFLYQNHWHHVFRLNAAAATDSVVCVPLDR